MTPPATLPADAATTLPASSTSVPPQDPPVLPGGACNVGMDGDSTYDRYLWVVRCARAALTASASMGAWQSPRYQEVSNCLPVKHHWLRVNAGHVMELLCPAALCKDVYCRGAHRGRYLIDQGLYVALDYHSSLGSEALTSVAVRA